MTQATLPFEPDPKTQRQRIAERLRQGPVNTLELMGGMYILRGAARICELRENGLNIKTLLNTPKHGITTYVLVDDE